MSEAFRGEHGQKVDGKARLLIPAPFRRVLEQGDAPTSECPRTRVVIVYGGKARSFCECYTQSEADKLCAQIALLPPGSAARLRAERELVTRSATVEIDDDGRIVLPAAVREKLGLSLEELKRGAGVVLAGATNRFTLWRSDVYQAAIEEDEDDLVDPLTLLPHAASGAFEGGG